MSTAEWERLGAEVVARRVELGMRTREAFSGRTGLSTRLLSDLEKGRKAGYDRGTLLVVETALDWAPGSVDAILGGGDPIVVDHDDGSLGDVDTAVTLDEIHDLQQSAARLAIGLLAVTAGSQKARSLSELADEAQSLHSDLSVIEGRLRSVGRRGFGADAMRNADGGAAGGPGTGPLLTSRGSFTATPSDEDMAEIQRDLTVRARHHGS